MMGLRRRSLQELQDARKRAISKNTPDLYRKHKQVVAWVTAHDHPR